MLCSAESPEGFTMKKHIKTYFIKLVKKIDSISDKTKLRILYCGQVFEFLLFCFIAFCVYVPELAEKQSLLPISEINNYVIFKTAFVYGGLVASFVGTIVFLLYRLTRNIFEIYKENKKDKSLKEQLTKKYLNNGLVSMSENEILQLLLSFSERKNISDISESLLKRYGSISNISKVDTKILLKDNILNNQSVVLIKLIAVMSRLYNIDKSNINRIDCVQTAIDFLKNYYIGVSSEKIAVIALESGLIIKDYCFILSGTNEDVKVSCRDISKFALSNDVDMIIIAHNHPLGESKPSQADIATTKQLIKILKNVGVVIIDHIIIGQNDCSSMREILNDSLFKDIPDCGYKYDIK